jgi:transposase
MMGRPTKLTPEVREQVVELVRQLNYAETAAGCAGIGKSTYYRWMKRGEDEESGPYREFKDAVRLAEAEAEMKALAMVRDAAPRDWRAATWFLERRFPHRWGRRERRDMKVAGQPIPIQIITTDKPPE